MRRKIDYRQSCAGFHTGGEMTLLAMAGGILFALLFAATNTYLGLKVGMTISASIPGAVLGTAVSRGLFRRQNVLETNLMQATGSAGESVASGIMFTLPALIIWGFNDQFTLARVAMVGTLGSILGVLFVVPLRRNLTVDDKAVLPYPEGMATAEVLVAGQAGGPSVGGLLWGGLVGGAYKLFSGALGLFQEKIEWSLPGITNGIFGFDVLASLLGVGFIIGLDIGLYLFAGGLLTWLVLIPLISYFGANAVTPLFPSDQPIAVMNAWEIWSNYIRYIGAGAVAAGGFIGLFRSLPMIVRSFQATMQGLSKQSGKAQDRVQRDISAVAIFFGVLGVFVCAILVPQMNVTWVGALAILVFGFFFAAVSARIAGIVGVTNLPVSGMTIAALLASTVMLRAAGVVDSAGMIASITTGATICMTVAIAGSLAQNLKTAHLVGATPKWVEFGVMLGGILSTLVVGGVMLMLHQAYGIGSDKIPAPQATLMSMVVSGVITSNLPWALVTSGIALGIVFSALRLPVLPIAIGLYLPLHLSAGIMVGAVVRWCIEQRFEKKALEKKLEKGILFASGLIAGDAVVGIFIAFFAFRGIIGNVAVFAGWPVANNPWWGLGMFVMLGLLVYSYIGRQESPADDSAKP